MTSHDTQSYPQHDRTIKKTIRTFFDHMSSYLIIWHNMISYDLIWYHMTSHEFLWCHMISSDVIGCHMILYDSRGWRRGWNMFNEWKSYYFSCFLTSTIDIKNMKKQNRLYKIKKDPQEKICAEWSKKNFIIFFSSMIRMILFQT